MSVQRSPSAEKAPGLGGTSTRVMPSSAATAAACSGPAPAEWTRQERGEIDGALGGLHADLVGHAAVDQADDPERRGDWRDAHRTRQGLERALRGRAIERLRSAEKIVRVEIAAKKIG